MQRTYKRAMWGSGIVATLVILPYTAISIMAMSDGELGFEIPREMSMLCALIVLMASTVLISSWVVDKAATFHADLTLRPIIRAECERAMKDAMPELVELVALELLMRLDPKLHDVASATASRQNAMLRELITGEVMRTQLDSAVGRAYRGGMLQQAQSAVGTAKVRNIRTATSTDD